MQQNITLMLQFCASELALSSVTSQVVWLMDQVSQLALPSSFLFLMLYTQWKREHSHKENDSGQRYTSTTTLSQNLLLSSNIHWVPTMHQVWYKVKKKPLAISEEEDTEAKPHHPEVVASRNHTFIMGTLPDGYPNIHHHVNCIRHI